MHCKDGRVLEISVTISVAPGFLSGYTKIVRFTPRFVLVNQLEKPIRLWQDSSLLHTVYDDRSTQQSDLKGQSIKEKWHVRSDDDGIDKVSQYEVLFGRSAILNQVDGISLGTAAHHSAQYIATVRSRSLAPFHLPDTRGDRQLRIDVGENWNLSPSFNADVTGEHTLRIQKAMDLRLLQHVNTRASPHYKVILPPPDGDLEWDGELGVWFETDWGGDRRIIVKGTKRGRYSFNHTDIHVGDELLRIDKMNVCQMTFAETMKLLKERVALISLAREETKLNVTRRGKAVATRQKRMLQRVSSKEELAVLGEDQLVLTFRTLEERLRRLRIHASKTRRVRSTKGTTRLDLSMTSSSRSSKHRQHASDARENQERMGDLKVEMRNIHSSLFVVVREQDPETPPYRIENRAINHIVFFRQRGCSGHPWNILKPGETKIYSWEEPMKPRKLNVKIGSNSISLRTEDGSSDGYGLDDVDDESDSDAENNGGRAARLKQVLSAQYVDSEERGGFGAVRTVKLEEIGFNDLLPCPGVRDGIRSNSGHDPRGFLNCQVDTDGATRVLIVSDNKVTDDRSAMQKHISTIERKIRDEENRRESFRSLEKLVDIGRATRDEEKDEEGQHLPLVSHLKPSSRQPANKSLSKLDNVGPEMVMIEEEAKVIADFPEVSSITRRHQVIVEVLEATGLRPYEVTGICNPYCEIVVKGRSEAKRSLFTSSKIRKRTYYVEKSLAPKWTNQIFVFDVPEDAAVVTRGHSVQFRVRNFRFVGSHPCLGQTNVHLRSLRNQSELVGWYPLVGRTGRKELEDSQANWGLGSVKLRMQWVYTVPALLDYFLLLSERRLADLRESQAGMKQQLEHLIEIESLKKGTENNFSMGKIPNLLGIRATQKQRLQQGIPWALFDNQEGAKKTKWKLGAMADPLRQSRDNLMWLLYFQTAESRSSRRLGNIESKISISNAEAPQMARGRLASVVENCSRKDEVESQKNDHNSLEERGADIAVSFASLQNASIEEMYRSSMTEHRGGSGLGSSIGRRTRSFSTEDVRPEQMFNGDVFDFAMRARSSTYDGSIDGLGSIFKIDADLLATKSKDEADRSDAVNCLFRDGFVYHRNNAYFHKCHLSYGFRAALLETQGAAQSLFRLKSPHRVAASIKQFRSWTAAHAILNDKGLQAVTKNFEFQVCLLKQTESTTICRDVGTSSSEMAVIDNKKLEESCHSYVLKKLQLPSFAPPAMQHRAHDRAEGIYLARNQFERACKRSLRAVLNPGGWLTVRPITALNLSDSFTGMLVKLHYGAESVQSQTVEARVTPCWASESPPNDDGKSERTSNRPSTPVSDNDLQVYVEQQKTSGSIRLSIVGERMNQRTELGVLHIPLGAAISCCVECMEDNLQTESDTMPIVPMYVRWFPLMSPKDSVAVDGDMGNSFKPLETEQLRDSSFTHYFTPCIKLALIWQPDQEETASGARPPEMEDQKSPLTEKYFNADFSRVSMSLIDSQRAIELFSLALNDIDVRYSMTKGKTRMGVVMGWIQVDHQDPKARESVVLVPTPVEHPQPTLQFLAVKDNLRSKGNIDSYEYIGLSLQELDLTVEEALMFAVWEFIISVVRRREVKRKVAGGSTGNSSRSRDRPSLLSTSQFRSHSSQVGTVEGNPESTLYTVLFGDNSSGELLNDQKVYVEQLILGFVKINFSYLKGKRGNWELTEGGEFITTSIDGLTPGLPEKMALKAGGLRLTGGRKRESQSEVLGKWASYTHDEDLWTDSGEGKSLSSQCIIPSPTV